jgi:hypothetical protein
MGRRGVAFRTVRASEVRSLHTRTVIGGVHPVGCSDAGDHHAEEKD